MIGHYEKAISIVDQVYEKLEAVDGVVKEAYDEIRKKAERLI